MLAHIPFSRLEIRLRYNDGSEGISTHDFANLSLVDALQHQSVTDFMEVILMTLRRLEKKRDIGCSIPRSLTSIFSNLGEGREPNNCKFYHLGTVRGIRTSPIRVEDQRED